MNNNEKSGFAYDKLGNDPASLNVRVDPRHAVHAVTAHDASSSSA
jgi:hypothetical protein